MNTWEYGFWEVIVQLGIIMSAMLFANTLRRKISFIKKSLLPSSVLGGVLIFALKFWPAFGSFINQTFMEGLAYHCLALGFIAIALKRNEKTETTSSKTVLAKTGAIVVSTYLLQGFIGVLITIPLSLILTQLLPASGLLLALGFGQGTGQALNFGRMYEGSYGFVGGASFGLTIATIGFLVACIVGAIYLNILRRQNKVKIGSETKETVSDEAISDPNDVPLSESIDRFTIQMALVLSVYFITYLFMAGLTVLIDNGVFGEFGINTVKPMIWGFNFLLGTLFAIITKKVIFKLRKANVMTREYPNNFLLNRISGLVFDVMVVAGCCAINIQSIEGLIVPLVLVCVSGIIFTFLYLNYVTPKVYPAYRYEAMTSLFGMLTGTASTGIILLREIDPNFETPAANNLVLQNVFAMIMGFPLMLLLGIAPQGFTEACITGAILLVMFISFNFFILRKNKKIK